MFADTRSNVVVAVDWMNFKVPHPGFAQRLFLDGVPGRRRVLVMTAALIFDRQDRPAAAVDDKNVGALAVDRMKRVLIGRLENFAKACLREDAVTSAQCRHLVFDDFEDAIFGQAQDPLLLE
jgi:hypothetical protein